MLIDLLTGLTAAETTRSKGRTPSHLESLDLCHRPQGADEIRFA